MGITNFGLTFIYIIPTLGRIAIIWIFQGTSMNLIYFLPEFAWLYNSLSMESRNILTTSFKFIWNYVPLILEMSLMRVLFTNLRKIIDGRLSPTRTIQPSQLANKWMTAAIRNREGKVGCFIGNPDRSMGVSDSLIVFSSSWCYSVDMSYHAAA
jgi:hypothetical protein